MTAPGYTSRCSSVRLPTIDPITSWEMAGAAARVSRVHNVTTETNAFELAPVPHFFVLRY